ncbi:hypothetical protein vseg_005764 [Gypsophila vaccaria]
MAYPEFEGKCRLPEFATPKRYDVHLTPDLVTCAFQGVVKIDVNIVSSTKYIVLNAADLSVDHSSLSFLPISSSQEMKAVNVGMIKEDEILVAEFGEELPLGVGVLSISFQGTLNDQMKGFYKSTYEFNGEKRNMAVTQFEPADARRCFPCWDEPAAKATFKITLDVPSDLVALSNMPVERETKHGDLKTVYFEESPIMSTYLVAVVVGMFDYIESHTSDGIKVRCYCQVGKTDQGKFALGVAVKTLELYRKYFDVPYSLPKLDMIAIPDFAAGAMENYGLVTYRETALLYDEKHSAAANKQRVAIVVAHELAHQWFGNLVTMEWWTHLWLNEGFATWVSYLAADVLFPEWNIWTQFLDQTVDGLRLDGLSESHPIEVDINHASEIDEIFDAISYRKGASVIRMLQSYLGADTFQRALASYIKKYACSNAKTEDLWAVLEEESGEPVKQLMNSWTQQKGYPFLSAKLKDQKLELEQSLFLLSGSPGEGEWIVPVTLCCGSYDTRQSFLLKEKTGAVDVKDSTWIKLNVDQTAFYRVKYDEVLEAKLRQAIEGNKLTPTDRFGVLDDSYALCTSGRQSLTSLLTLMGSFKEETDYTVLSHLITISYKVVSIVADATPAILDDLKKYFINLFKRPAGKLGWEPKPGESHLDAMLRGEILTVLAEFGHEDTLNEATRRFDAFCADRDSPLLPPDTRKAAYTAVMQKVTASNKSGYEALLKVYKETDLSQEKSRIIGSLASCPDPNVVLEVLNFLLSPEVRSQDAIFGLGVSFEGREIAWKWLQENWDHISKTWGSGYLIARFISAIVSPFSSIEKAKEVEEYFASRMKPAIARTLRQSIERVHINAGWVQAVQKDNHLAQVVVELSQRN